VTANGNLVLLFNGGGASWQWDSVQIFNFFNDNPWKPRLMLLNACNSAVNSEYSASVAEALLDAGVHAVIAAQALLRVDYARAFAEAFYGELVKAAVIGQGANLEFDKAVAQSRGRVSALPGYNGLDRRHWALPVLVTRTAVENLLTLQRANGSVKSCVTVKDVFARAGRFANRSADRWNLLSKFLPAQADETAKRGVIVKGGSQLGKSWLVKRAMRDFVDSGFLVRHADMSAATPRTSLDVLEDWRGRSGQQGFLVNPLPAAAFAEFDKCLAEARQTKSARDEEKVFAAFKRGLQEVRGERKVLLVLDRLRRHESGWSSVSQADFQQGLLEQLLLPIQTGAAETEGVYILLIAREFPNANGQPADADEFGLTMLNDFFSIALQPLSIEALENVMDEFMNFQANEGLSGLRLAIKAHLKSPVWRPGDLEKFNELVKIFAQP
jgi:hypothetical protein